MRPELSPEAGFPFKAAFRECLLLERNVGLFLFETADGRPMAQFLDCLRGVWEPPHAAIVPIDAAHADLTITTPNLYQEARHAHEATKLLAQGVVVDVGDGCRPVIATLLGKDLSYDDFRKSLAKSKIVPLRRNASLRVSHLPVGCADTLCPVNSNPLPGQLGEE